MSFSEASKASAPTAVPPLHEGAIRTSGSCPWLWSFWFCPDPVASPRRFLPEGRERPLPNLANGQLARQAGKVICTWMPDKGWCRWGFLDDPMTFIGVEEMPLLSLGRRFSAPIHIKAPLDRTARAALMGKDKDSFNRWESGQALASDVIAYLFSKGFNLICVANLAKGKSKRPIQADFLFSRS